MYRRWTAGPRGHEGATSVEYAIMASLVAVVVMLAVAALGTATRISYECAASRVGALSTAPGEPDC
jgi:Flp pilus assembly pilin Flp